MHRQHWPTQNRHSVENPIAAVGTSGRAPDADPDTARRRDHGQRLFGRSTPRPGGRTSHARCYGARPHREARQAPSSCTDAPDALAPARLQPELDLGRHFNTYLADHDGYPALTANLLHLGGTVAPAAPAAPAAHRCRSTDQTLPGLPEHSGQLLAQLDPRTSPSSR